MSRYLRLLLYFTRFSLTKAMAFRMDFLFRTFMDVVYYGICVVFFQIVFGSTDLLAGWTRDQITVFLGVCFVIDAIQMTFFANGLWEVKDYVNKGSFDYYLVRPVSALFMVSFHEFSLGSFCNILVASTFLLYGLYNLTEPLILTRIPPLLLLIGNGVLLFYLIRVIFTATVFWLHRSSGVESVFYDAAHAMERPERVFTGLGRFLFVYVLPFSAMTSIPARYLFEGNPTGVMIESLTLTLVFSLLTTFIWRRALAAYASASS